VILQQKDTPSPHHFWIISTAFTTLTMVTEREKRVVMTKQLKKKVFAACLVKVSYRSLPVGALKAVTEAFEKDQRQYSNDGIQQ
jgi:hypothetical protein